ncbi:MAG: hypothetical protein KTR31_06820 [Myxococcales bacterium]|nr:hypothetical protein [Myxococcales bacterium]
MKQLWSCVLWGALLWVTLVGNARAASLAVLPLQAGQSSEDYLGLGKGLAGMFVTDLLTIDGLRLVERERVQSLLDEMALSSTGLLDPATAQKLGKGVGAEYLLLGSYSVVRDTFLLDVRVVAVQTGDVVKGADSQGSIEDFVAVQKEVTEALLEGLDVTLTAGDRRRLMSAAATESFSALVAFSEGLERADQGDLEGAERAFRKALSDDPDFMAARSSLGDLSGALAEGRAEREERLTTYANKVHEHILQTTTDETTMTGSEVSVEHLVDLALRIEVLRAEGRHCQRAREMRHYGDRIGWTLPELDRKQWFRVKDEVRHKPMRILEKLAPELRFRVSADPVTDINDLLLHEMWFSHRDEHLGLVGSLLQCHQGQTFLTELDALQQALPAELLSTPARRASPLTIADILDATWALQHAKQLGPSEALTRKVRQILSRYPNDSDAHERLLRKVEQVERAADQVQAARRRRLGKTPEEIERVVRAAVEGDDTIFRSDGPYCTYIATSRASGLTAQLAALDQARTSGLRKDKTFIEVMASDIGPMEDFGCVVGVQPRFEHVSEVIAHASSLQLLPTAEPSCARTKVTITQMTVHPAMLDRDAPTYTESYEGSLGWMASYMLWQLVRDDCVAWD